MNKRELKKALKNSETWTNPSNAVAVAMFGKLMRRRRYGFSACNQAWAFFIDGWNCAKVRLCTLTISDVGVSKSALVAGGEPVSLDRKPGSIANYKTPCGAGVNATTSYLSLVRNRLLE